MLKLASLVALLVLATPAAASDTTESDGVLEELRALPPMRMDEVIWLARCLLSESDRTDEQRLVAWVVRNRVETRYRGYSYREVVESRPVRDPTQLAFGSRGRHGCVPRAGRGTAVSGKREALLQSGFDGRTSRARMGGSGRYSGSRKTE